ncbi:MAG TPA: DM13 domain-containing protein [Solirubrobacteraceae bacterium]|nr:DM13 domain-containing protein [Solirubrobacteraceae bacterium]
MRGIACAVTAATLLAVAGCGGDDDETDRFGEIPKRTIVAPADETAPRWQELARLRGSGETSEKVTVSKDALQWRIRWGCEEGQIDIAVKPAPESTDGLASSSCPDRDSVIWVGSGERTVNVSSPGRYRVVIEEEVRTPLREPALAEMRSGEAREIARGRFSPIDLKGRGTATLYELPGGRLALRMEGFGTDPNPDLDVWLSESAEPTNTRRIFRAKHTTVGPLKSTIGDQNYILPTGTDASRVRSVVVVNNPERIAYAAAKLAR